MFTPSGRFQPDRKICFSMSDFHPGTVSRCCRFFIQMALIWHSVSAALVEPSMECGYNVSACSIYLYYIPVVLQHHWVLGPCTLPTTLVARPAAQSCGCQSAMILDPWIWCLWLVWLDANVGGDNEETDNLPHRLTGLLSFMLSDEMTTGSVTSSDSHKRAFAARSHSWNITQPRFKDAFPEVMWLLPLIMLNCSHTRMFYFTVLWSDNAWFSKYGRKGARKTRCFC